MLEYAAAAGTTDNVATPHANGKFAFDSDLVEQRIAELRPKVRVRIHAGCDFRLQSDNVADALKHPTKYTVNHKNYLLVEVPARSLSAGEEALMQLLAAGLVPIVTHPERDKDLRRRLKDLTRWVQAGCRLQITAGSLTGAFGGRSKSSAHELIRRGLVHFVASDAHDCRFRAPSLHEAYRDLSETWGEDVVRPMFVDNPRSVLAGERFEFSFRPATRKRKKWYQLWRS